MTRVWRRAGMAVGCAVSAVLGTLIVSTAYVAVASPAHCTGGSAQGYCTYTISPIWYLAGAVGAVALFVVMVRVVLAAARLVRGRIAEAHEQPIAP